MDGNTAGTSLQATGQSPPGTPDTPGTLSSPKLVQQAQAAEPHCRAKHPSWGRAFAPTGLGVGAGGQNRVLAARVSWLQAGPQPCLQHPDLTVSRLKQSPPIAPQAPLPRMGGLPESGP